MIRANKFAPWRKIYTMEVEKNVNYYNYLNNGQPVHTRQMTEKEISEVFGEKNESCHKLKLEREVRKMDYNDIIHNARIYDFDESLIAAGYPMRTKVQNMDKTFQQKDWERAISLTKAVKNDNQAHGQFLTGIRVSFDLTFTNKAWIEAERYRFLEFVSSQSTMHCITKFDIDNQYIEYTDKRMIEIMKELIAEYNKEPTQENYLKVLYSNPIGFKITARITTNYRCLMNIYQQRKTHRLPEWRAFCKWIESLPYSELITAKENKSNE